MFEYIWVVPLLPLVGFLFNGVFGYRFNEKQVAAIACGAIGLSFVITIVLFFQFIQLPGENRFIPQTIYTWIQAGNFKIDINFMLDPLSMVMLLVVTGVGTLIHIYSIGYMHGDRGVARYFAFLNLFTFAMLVLVLADNFLLMFVGWEGVGLCSYLLIGFWYENEDFAYAGRKAFVVNRIGDFGFLLGIFLIFMHFGSLQFETVFSKAPDVLNAGTATVICLLLFVGAMGKSAQIPLYVWLPDAMAGPTPVSALIHAATMVTAGVYMLARTHILYLQSPTAMFVVAVVGAATAFLAATIALVHNDIKKVLAYSTISQLGYMFLACGVGAFGAGIFHLTTHAFFKALLFLSAGSVMHALSGETDMTKMGGLKKKLPITFKVFLVGAMALSGVPLFSGFFSKDEILWRAVSSPLGGFGFWFVGALVAGLTAFYSFRLIFMTFYGKSKVSAEVEKHVHESPNIMAVPLIILAVLSVIGGYVGIPHYFTKFEHFLDPVFSHYITTNLFERTHDMVGIELSFMTVSTLIVFMGIGFAYLFYLVRPSIADTTAQRFKGVYTFLYNKWYVDELYNAVIVKPVEMLSENVLWKWFDVKIIDGFVNLVPRLTGKFSGVLRRTETGVVQNYAFTIVFGVVLLLGYFLLK